MRADGLGRIAVEMLSTRPETKGFSLLADIARHLDKTDKELGYTGDAMQRDLRRWEKELRAALDAFTTSDCRQAVAPKASDASGRPPSVEALEAERDEARRIARIEAQAYADLEAEDERLAAERDQAIKERDRLVEAAWAVVEEYQPVLLGTKLDRLHSVLCEILRSALAGVPGGGRQEQDLGGDRGRSPVVGSEEA